MTLVSARPRALRRYSEGVEVADAGLRDRAEQLREVLDRYRRSSPDVGGDHTAVADDLELLSRDALALSRSVHQIASAFERLDELPDAVADLFGDVPGDVRRLPVEVFEHSYEKVATAWDRLDHLDDVVEDLDPQRWGELVWGVPCRPSALGGYTGSGAVRGPDGRLYPLVIPELEVEGAVRHVSYDGAVARDPGLLGGADPGWVVVDEAVGVARVEAFDPGVFSRLAVVGGIFAGYSPVQQRWASPEQLETVTFGPNGAPALAHGDWPGRLPQDPRLPHRTAPTEFEHVRWGRGLGTVESLATAGEAYLAASQLEYPGVNAYRVLFEQHEDGSRRARMHTYQIATTREGSTFVPYMGYAVAGELRRKMVTPVPERRNAMSQRGGPPPDRRGSTVGPTPPTGPPAP